jgi:esterase/lipase superfamily enzyme
VTLCLVLIAANKRSMALWVVSALGMGVCLGLGYQAASSTLLAIRWDGKVGPQYTIDRAPDGKVQLGVCEVTIPRTHDPGELEAPSILRLEVREDAERHVILSKTEPLAGEAFYELLRQRVQASPRKELFVFIHGFDTQFEAAARRTAQIHYDLKFQGAPIFFSWPANNKSILTYPADENTIGWSAPHLKAFLLQIVQRSEAQSINLIAHSMGNRALSTALREIELEFRGQSQLFNHVVLAAPDIDADEFRTNIAPAMQRTANHVTLYASSRDDALRVSQLLHRGPRAGDSGRGLVVLPGMDTIDVTAIDTSPWGHIYLGASDPVLQDLKYLFLYGFSPQERRWLSPAQREGLTYWIFEASQTASRAGLTPR